MNPGGAPAGRRFQAAGAAVGAPAPLDERRRRWTSAVGAARPKSGGVDGTRTRDLLRDRQAF